MDNLTRIIIVGYCSGVALAALIVPWIIDLRGGWISRQGYGLIFSPPVPEATIDFGVVLLEIVAMTAIAGVAYLTRDKWKGTLPREAQLNAPRELNIDEEIWYYALNNVVSGGLSQRWLQTRFDAGSLEPDTLVWSKHLTDWTPASRSGVFRFKGTPSPSALRTVSPLGPAPERRQDSPGEQTPGASQRKGNRKDVTLLWLLAVLGPVGGVALLLPP